ncbi:MAG TPA: alpha/beta hydrolase-fold protein [Terriglobia bacterium]|nr:alpha/beta hydrolase-fold protein [Terriglobia bacterium]
MSHPARSTSLMRVVWIGLAAIALALPAAQLSGQRRGALRGGAQEKIDIRTYKFKEAGNKKQEYALFVPSGYKKSQKTPLIVALHGLGGNPRQILATRGFASLAEQRGYILVAPYGYNERGWYGAPMPGSGLAALLGRGSVEQTGRRGALAELLRGSPDDPPNLGELSEKDVLNVLALVRKDYNIDPDRTFLMGHSMGGGGTWHLGMKYPDQWAALGPIAPAITTGLAGLDKIRRMPVIVVQGDSDNLVPVAGTRRWVERMKDLEMTYQYIEVAGGDHISVVAPNLPKIFDFFDKHPRQKTK